MKWHVVGYILKTAKTEFPHARGERDSRIT